MAEQRGWWRRNAVALVALAVLVPATFGGAAWWEWKYAYPDSGKPLFAVEPGKSGTVDLEGATWGPAKAKVITDTSGLDVPEGAQLVLVGVDVDPTGNKAPTCWSPTLVEQSTGRTWETARGEIGLTSSSDEPDSCVPTLEGETAEPYQLILPFIVPDEAEGPYWVIVEPLFAESRFARFSIDP